MNEEHAANADRRLRITVLEDSRTKVSALGDANFWLSHWASESGFVVARGSAENGIVDGRLNAWNHLAALISRLIASGLSRCALGPKSSALHFAFDAKLQDHYVSVRFRVKCG